MDEAKENKEQLKVGKFWTWMVFVVLGVFELISKRYKSSIDCFIIALGAWGMESMFRIVIREFGPGSKKANGALIGLASLGIAFMVLAVHYLTKPIYDLFW